MRPGAKSIVRVATVLVTVAVVAAAGCLKISEPSAKGLSIVAEPDTTPILVAPLSVTMVAGPSANPAGLAYVFTVRNTADTVAGMFGVCSGGITLRASPDTTGATVQINYPPCTASIALQSLQPGQSISFSLTLPNAYIARGTAQADYYVWVQLPVPTDPRTGKSGPQRSAPAGRVHWGG